MRTSAFVIASLAAAASQPALADDRTQYQDVIDWSENQANPNYRASQTELRKMLSLVEVEAFKVEGTSLTLQPIQFPADRDSPDCGTGSESEASKKANALLAIGTFLAGGAGERTDDTGNNMVRAVGLAIAAVGYGIGGGGGPRSDTSSCGIAYVVVPGTLTDPQVKSLVKLHYFFGDDRGSSEREISPNIDVGWASAGDYFIATGDLSISRQSWFAKSRLVKQGNSFVQSDVYTCPVTVIGVPFKNWSHNRTRSLRLEATINKSLVTDGSCIDATQINKNIYGKEYVYSLPKDTVAAYYAWLRDRILKSL